MKDFIEFVAATLGCAFNVAVLVVIIMALIKFLIFAGKVIF
ncbi:hypothetical protein [Enterococcus sp. AZ103]